MHQTIDLLVLDEKLLDENGHLAEVALLQCYLQCSIYFLANITIMQCNALLSLYYLADHHQCSSPFMTFFMHYWEFQAILGLDFRSGLELKFLMALFIFYLSSG